MKLSPDTTRPALLDAPLSTYPLTFADETDDQVADDCRCFLCDPDFEM